jgi:peptide-methionine (S)-S-oxide reductase
VRTAFRLASSTLLLSACLLLACGAPESGHATQEDKSLAKTGQIEPGPGQEAATFAGGCFWCMVAPFAELPGVVSVTSGYSGGTVENPSYEQVSSGRTGHAESVQVVFDPQQVSYDKLLSIFWHSIDPTDAAGQFCDIGSQYRTAVFFHGDQQKEQAKASRDALEKGGTLGAPVVTEITAYTAFYPAEDYHQDFYRKQELRYQGYRAACGRDAALRRLHGKDAVTSHH